MRFLLNFCYIIYVAGRRHSNGILQIVYLYSQSGLESEIESTIDLGYKVAGESATFFCAPGLF